MLLVYLSDCSPWSTLALLHKAHQIAGANLIPETSVVAHGGKYHPLNGLIVVSVFLSRDLFSPCVFAG